MEAHIYIDDHEFAELAKRFDDGTGLFQKSVKAALRRAGSNMRKNLIKGIRGASYLKVRDITDAFDPLQVTDTEARVRVAGRLLPADRFKLVPNRITARKGIRSVNWPSPGVSIGPGEPMRHLEEAGFSKPFITKFKNGHKGMYWREKYSGKLKTPFDETGGKLPWERPDEQVPPFLQAHIFTNWQTPGARKMPAPGMESYE